MWHMSDGWGRRLGFGWIWMIVLMAVIGGWGMGLGWIWMIIPMAVIVWAVLRYTERGAGRHEPPASVEPSPQEILEQRYVAGELSDEQYEAMRHRLSRPPEPKAA